MLTTKTPGEPPIWVLDLDAQPDTRHPLDTAPISTAPPVAAALPSDQRLRVARAAALSFIMLLPTVVVTVYAFGWAAHRYQTEAQLVIRSAGAVTDPVAAAGVNLSGLAGAGAPIAAGDSEGPAIEAFLRSRDAVVFLSSRMPLREMLNPPGDAWVADPWWRFPMFPWSANNEERFFRHYLRFVEVANERGRGIVTVRTQAFSAADAERLANGLVAGTEILVNRLGDRPAEALVRTAETEVDRLRSRALTAQSALTEWRERERLIDPSRTAAAYVETIARLSLDRAQTAAQAAELRAAQPRSPQIAPLDARVVALAGQISAEREAMAGPGIGLSQRLGEFERLVLERDFAERAHQSALVSLEAARRDAGRQRLFVEAVVAPRAPDWPRYPRPWLLAAVALGLNLVLLLIGRALWKDTASHRLENMRATRR